MVGVSQELLLWPQDMSVFAEQAKHSTSTPRRFINPLASAPSDSAGLLWPAALINDQARAHRQDTGHISTLAVVAFALSGLLGVVIGPVLLAVIALSNNYTWATTVFYDSMLKTVAALTIILAILDIVILALLYRHPSLKQRVVIALVGGSLVEIGLVWLFSYLIILSPPQLMLVLLAGVIILFLVILFISKQYVAKPTLSLAPKLIMGTLVLLATSEIGLSTYYLIRPHSSISQSEVEQLATAQTEARLEGVAEQLSNLIYTLCGGRYSIIGLSEFTPAGLFECNENGEVYSVAEDTLEEKNPTGGATYMGTTKDPAVGIYFPNAYYLYRSLPQVLSEDELALMLPAASEQELVDNLTPMLLSYWQDHSDHNLFLNAFYNTDINQITQTKDYVLMSALGTMVMAEGLPHGLSIRGVANGNLVNYLYHADTELAALNELGGAPERYATSTREALMTHRHISLHLAANEPLDYESLTARLWEAFTGGI